MQRATIPLRALLVRISKIELQQHLPTACQHRNSHCHRTHEWFKLKLLRLPSTATFQTHNSLTSAEGRNNNLACSAIAEASAGKPPPSQFRKRLLGAAAIGPGGSCNLSRDFECLSQEHQDLQTKLTNQAEQITDGRLGHASLMGLVHDTRCTIAKCRKQIKLSEPGLSSCDLGACIA